MRKPLLPLFLTALATTPFFALIGCATHDHSHGGAGPDSRPYNPQNEQYERQTPGRPSTSAGASNTTR